MKTLAGTRPVDTDRNDFSICQQNTDDYFMYAFPYSRTTPPRCPSRLYFTGFFMRISYGIVLEIDLLSLLCKVSRSPASRRKHGLTWFVLDKAMCALVSRLKAYLGTEWIFAMNPNEIYLRTDATPVAQWVSWSSLCSSSLHGWWCTAKYPAVLQDETDNVQRLREH